MSTNDGGPAFPQNDAAVNRINNHDGMSLRDYFAAKAMPELTADAIVRMRSEATEQPHRTGMDDFEWADGSTTWAEGIAVEAYQIADAMLRAREVKP